ncbi:MAG TPA: hypothetical protein VH008_12630 [Pseudonocardia sp.]|nr:hypothetical protein [Pseudonocardia sp.]
MGHVPQRSIHRARYQRPPWLRQRTLSHPCGVRIQAESGVGVPDVIASSPPNAGVCLCGLSPHSHRRTIDLGRINQGIVLRNIVVFGSVNANRRHYRLAASALAKADPTWLGRLITREVHITEFADALTPRDNDIKTVLTMARAH